MLDGHRGRWRLSIVGRHLIRIRVYPYSWTDAHRGICESGVGTVRFVVSIFSPSSLNLTKTPAASIAGLVSIAIFKGSIKDFSIGSTDHEVLKAVDRAWRLLIGLGCVPAAIALYFRLTIPETPRFTMDVERNLKQAMQDIDRFLSSGTYKYDPDSIVVRVDAPRASKRNFFEYFSKWDNLKILLGCAYAWFAVDVSLYYSTTPWCYRRFLLNAFYR